MTPRERLIEQEELLFLLIFDDEQRETFLSNRACFLKEAHVSEETFSFFNEISAFGLEADAHFRRDYVMSTLCRAFPISAGIIGATAIGRKTLTRFLASPTLFLSTRERNFAFAEHLEQIVEFNAAELDVDVLRLLSPYLNLEHARLKNAANLRLHVEKKGVSSEIKVQSAPDATEILTQKMRLAAFSILGELPFSQSVLQNALDGISPQDAWHKIAHQHLEPERIQSVARSLHLPKTFLQRGILKKISPSAFAENSPLIDVMHLAAEIDGNFAHEFSEFKVGKKLSELSLNMQHHAQTLLKGSLLVLRV